MKNSRMSFREVDELYREWRKIKRKCGLFTNPSYTRSALKNACKRRLGFFIILSLALIWLWTMLAVVYFMTIRDYQLPGNSSNLGRRGYNIVITQADLDHFAKNIQLNFTLTENSFFNKKLFQAEILLTNNGDRPFPDSGWEIIFSQPSLVEPQSYPYPNGVLKPKYGVRIYFLMGNVYRLVPTKGFGVVKPGSSKAIRYISEHSNVALTDVHPNWYFAGTGLEPRIIESTRGESLDFVAPYNSPAVWKRNTIPDDPDYDIYNPYTAADRYNKLAVEDLGTAPSPVIPTPVNIASFNPRNTVNVQDNTWVIVTAPKMANEARYLSELWSMTMVLRAPESYYITFVEEPVQLTVKGRRLPIDESYELQVSPRYNTITIKASHPAGAFYAIQTLLSLIDNSGNIPETVIMDAPRYKYRGILFDVARNFQSKEKIFRYLDVMAMYKLNKLHFHITDDEGWRLVIPGLEELTELGATRCHDLTETKCLLPFLGSGPFPGPPGSGFYTVEDYRDILRYATARHIEVIPEIDMPGHSHAAIKAMEARYKRLIKLNVTEASRFLLSDLQDKSDYLSVQSFQDGAMNPCLRSTYTFISRVLNSLFAMHRDISPLRVFNFGGDEVPEGTWKKSPVCNRLRESGVKTDLKQYMVLQIANMTSLYNLDLAAWEDGLMNDGQPMRRDKFPNRDVYVYAWNNVWEWGTQRRAYDFANSGYKVILTPATNFYIDHPYEPDPKERGLYWASRFTDTKKVFGTMPENLYMNADTYRSGRNITICQGEDKDDCPPLQRPENIEGIQASLFGELLRTQWITDYMLLPRMIALAERAWHVAPWESESSHDKIQRGMNKDWMKFANTLGYKELARLDRLGYKYRIPPPGAIVENDVLQTSVTFPGLTVEISGDGGNTWRPVDPKGMVIDPSGDYLLRSSAAFGTRYSREISLFEEFNMASSRVASVVVIVTGLAFALLAVKMFQIH